MTTVEASPSRPKTLKDPELKRALQTLRVTDNYTNWLYIARAYLVLTLSIGGAIAFYSWAAANGLHWAWNIPITILAIFPIGASQHQLAGATHEATHHTLFQNRMLNELVSDWLCMFPLFSSTYTFRQHHLAHHQFINDPERDPDFSQLRLSGHWLKFPVSKNEFLIKLLKQLWVPNLVNYIRIRAMYNSMGVDNNPYMRKGEKASRTPIRVGVLYMFSMMGALIGLSYAKYVIPSVSNTLLNILVFAIPAVMFAVVMAIYAKLPASMFPAARLKPVFSPRSMMMQRVSFVTLLCCALTWTQHFTGAPAWLYFLVLWIIPIFTAFSFFMILRQLVQHGNGDRGWLTNTRVFLVHPFINYAVFPFGMDYHLPHHMFATIPHYRLPQLHKVLSDYPEYDEHGIVVEGYFFPKHHHQENPTVLDVLGPEYAPHTGEVFIDDTVLDNWEFEGKEDILKEGAAERRSGKPSPAAASEES